MIFDASLGKSAMKVQNSIIKGNSNFSCLSLRFHSGTESR